MMFIASSWGRLLDEQQQDVVGGGDVSGVGTLIEDTDDEQEDVVVVVSNDDDDDDDDGFNLYHVSTNATPTWLMSSVGIYVGIALFIILPFVVYRSRQKEIQQQQQQQQHDTTTIIGATAGGNDGVRGTGGSQQQEGVVKQQVVGGTTTTDPTTTATTTTGSNYCNNNSNNSEQQQHLVMSTYDDGEQQQQEEEDYQQQPAQIYHYESNENGVVVQSAALRPTAAATRTTTTTTEEQQQYFYYDERGVAVPVVTTSANRHNHQQQQPQGGAQTEEEDIMAQRRGGANQSGVGGDGASIVSSSSSASSGFQITTSASGTAVVRLFRSKVQEKWEDEKSRLSDEEDMVSRSASNNNSNHLLRNSNSFNQDDLVHKNTDSARSQQQLLHPQQQQQQQHVQQQPHHHQQQQQQPRQQEQMMASTRTVGSGGGSSKKKKKKQPMTKTRSASHITRMRSASADHDLEVPSASAKKKPPRRTSTNKTPRTTGEDEDDEENRGASGVGGGGGGADDYSVASTSRLHRGTQQQQASLLLQRQHSSSQMSRNTTLSQRQLQQYGLNPHHSTRESGRKFPLRAWDLTTRMRWNQGQPLTPVVSMQRAIRTERQSQASEEGSQTSRSRNNNSWAAGGGGASSRRNLMQRQSSNRTSSEAASSFLNDEMIEGEAEFFRARYRERIRKHQRRPSIDVMSVMPPLSVGALGPEDAADAHDLGTANRIEDYRHTMPPTSSSNNLNSNSNGNNADMIQQHTTVGSRCCCGILCSCCCKVCDCILDLAELDYEAQRIMKLALPSTISSVAEPIFRLALVAIISHFVNTNSMIAYLLVILFLRLTTAEVSSVIADAESSLVQDALAEGGDYGFYNAGQHVLVAMIMQFIIGIPVLLVWVFWMEDIIMWLVASSTIATIAVKYTQVIVVDYILRGITRIYMLPLHLTGQGQFESTIDVISNILTMIAIIVVANTTANDNDNTTTTTTVDTQNVVSNDNNTTTMTTNFTTAENLVDIDNSIFSSTSTTGGSDLSLTTIGHIQVILAAAKTIIKVGYVTTRGWMKPYRSGMLNFMSLVNTPALASFACQTIPLFIGSVVELGEWELLVLMVRHLGGAEVAAWSMMGIMWETFGAATEGLGEAASTRVSYYLLEDMSGTYAQHLANKVALYVTIMALFVTSTFYVFGPKIITSLTTDSTLQHLLNDMIGFTGLANASMTYAQILWSLTGAQNRFGLASATILACRWFIIFPLSAISIFVYKYDLITTTCCVAIGYATATIILGSFVYLADWEELSKIAMMNEQQDIPMDDEDDDDDGEEGKMVKSEQEEENGDDDEEDVDDDSDDDESDFLF